MPVSAPDEHPLCYSAGAMILSRENPDEILYRSKEPVLSPLFPQERHRVVANVVFPTGIDRRDGPVGTRRGGCAARPSAEPT